MAEPEFWVLTKIVDDSDPYWNTNSTIFGSPQRIRSLFDLSRGVPFGWRLLKNKQARRFLKWSLKEELRYQREQETQKRFGGVN